MAKYEQPEVGNKGQEISSSTVRVQNVALEYGETGPYLTIVSDRFFDRYDDSGMPDPRSMVARYVVGISSASGGHFIGVRDMSMRDSTANSDN